MFTCFTFVKCACFVFSTSARFDLAKSPGVTLCGWRGCKPSINNNNVSRGFDACVQHTNVKGVHPADWIAGSGLVTHWEQESSTLICSGDVRNITLWDLQSEAKKQVGCLAWGVFVSVIVHFLQSEAKKLFSESSLCQCHCAFPAVRGQETGRLSSVRGLCQWHCAFPPVRSQETVQREQSLSVALWVSASQRPRNR